MPPNDCGKRLRKSLSQQNFHNNLDAKSQLAKALVKNGKPNNNNCLTIQDIR